MNIDELEEKIEDELEGYKQCYEEYNKALKRTISLIEELKGRFKKNK